MNTQAKNFKTDLPEVTLNDQALSRYKAVQAIMRTMRLGGLDTVTANEAADLIAQQEVKSAFFIRGSFEATMGTLSRYSKGHTWRVGTHADSGLSYAWKTSNPEPTEAQGVTNEPNEDLPGVELSTFVNMCTVSK